MERHLSSRVICCCCSVAKSCMTLYDRMDCITPGPPVHHHLSDFAQTHVHWVGDAIQPPHPLLPSFSSCPQSFPASGSSPVSQLFISCGQSIGASALASVLPMNIQGWFPLGWTSLTSLLSKGLSRVFLALQFQSINSSVLCLLYDSALTTVHDYWKDHSLDYADLCQQSGVFAF